MYRTMFTVRGAGKLPLDMLRYVGCYPDKVEDVYMLGDIHLREVTLVHHHKRKQSGLAPARWRTFGWSIVGSSVSKV